MPRPSRVREFDSTADVDDEGLRAWLAPRTDILHETDAGTGAEVDDGSDADTVEPVVHRFTAERSPFDSYERTVEVRGTGGGRHTIHQRVRVVLGFGLWSALFVAPMKAVLRRPGGRAPWWAPPEALDRGAATSLVSLANLSLVAGYLGTLVTQSLTYAADEFDASERLQGDTLAAIRIGVLLSMVIAAWADRNGRRRALLGCATAGLLVNALTAAAPGMLALGATQLVARGCTTALALLIVVVVAEEMPAGSRAYGVSILTMSGALGAGLVLWILPVVEFDERAWRILYVAPLLFLPLIRSTARVLPESRRFTRQHASARFAGHGRRLGLLAGSALLVAVFSTPGSQLQNEFLREEFGFTAATITLFTIATRTPGGLGIVIGGRLADTRGKRLIGGIGIAGGTIFTALQFLAPSTVVLWSAAAVGSIVGGLSVPALAVYGPELFPTSLRSKANVVITALGVCGSVIGLVVVGRLAERWSLGPAIALMAVAPAAVVLLLLPRYPETAHVELEELNPEDRLPTTFPGLGG